MENNEPAHELLPPIKGLIRILAKAVVEELYAERANAGSEKTLNRRIHRRISRP